MLPPLMTDRSHRNIFLPELRANMIRNHSLEDEVFDYNPVALRALKPNRIPLCNLQMPFQGSFLSPQPFFQQPPLVLESLTPVPERKFITELRRPNHVKNQHVQIFPSRHQLYFPPTSTNTARMDYSPALVKPALEEYYDAPAYPSALEDHTLEKQRRKIDTLISTGHQRTQSNIMVGSQSTKHLSMALKTDPGYGPGELPKHVTALEKYNIKVRKDVEKKSPTEITKGQNPSETSSGKKVKPRPPEEKSKKEEENSVTITKSKTEEKKQVTHHKSSGDDMRKQAIMNNLNKRAVSDPRLAD